MLVDWRLCDLVRDAEAIQTLCVRLSGCLCFGVEQRGRIAVCERFPLVRRTTSTVLHLARKLQHSEIRAPTQTL